jgi:Glycosyl hydrolase family 26/Bacterial Ig domain
MQNQNRFLISSLLVLVLCALLPAFSQGASPACLKDNNPTRLFNCAKSLQAAGQFGQAVQVMTKAASKNPTAANWKLLSDIAIQAEDFAVACSASRKAAELYDRIDINAATVLRNTRAQYCQVINLYSLEPANQGKQAAPAANLAKFEPANGLMLGLSTFPTELPSSGELPSLNALGGPLAVYFTYYPLRQDSSGPGVFPSKLAAAVKAVGAALHIALEPKMPLGDVTEESLIPFAQAAAASGVPIFLRFAGEFNDRFAPWSGNPKLYVQKFRVVHDLMAKIAPNVAMVWMPMATQTDCVKEYYPGKDFVDWVGVSLYSVPFLNGDTKFPGEPISPLEQLEKLYGCYAGSHPFQVSEYASSHANSGFVGQNFEAFSRRKLEDLYWGAALKFPRLKNINWLNLNLDDINEVVEKSATRQNDYRLLEVPVKLEAFKRIMANPYFLKSFGQSSPLQSKAFPAQVGFGKTLQISVYARTLKPVTQVEFLLDGKKIGESSSVPFAFALPNSLVRGSHQLEVRAMNGVKLAVSQVQVFTVK